VMVMAMVMVIMMVVNRASNHICQSNLGWNGAT